MSTWKLSALVAALAVCATAGNAIAAGTQKSAADSSGATATAPAAAPSAPTSAATADRDAENACASYAGKDRPDCMRNYQRATVECGSLGGQARDDCMRSARMKMGGAGGVLPSGDAPATAAGGNATVSAPPKAAARQ